MDESGEIFSLIEQKESEAAKAGRQALIIGPGGLGDCILTLPMVSFLKSAMDLGTVAYMGNMDFINAFVGRTCVDKIRSLEGTRIHRLFCKPKDFKIEERDPLLTLLGPYTYILSYLGEPGSAFEQNLIFAANCTHSAEVGTIRLKAPADFDGHISEFYIAEARRELIWLGATKADLKQQYIIPTHADKVKARVLLEEAGISGEADFAVIAPGSGGKAKCWPVKNFIACANLLKDRGVKPIFVFGPGEVEREGDFAGIEDAGIILRHPDIGELIGLLSLCKCYIGNDSGVSHLAGASGTRTIAIFGPTDSRLYHPLGPEITCIQFTEQEFYGSGKEGLERAAVEISKILTH